MGDAFVQRKLFAAFLLCALLPFTTAATCGPTGQKVAVDLEACAIGTVPAIVQTLLPNLVNAILGTAVQWAAEAATLVGEGLDLAECAIKAVVFDLQHQASSLHAKHGIAHVGQGPDLTTEEAAKLVQLERGLQRAEDLIARLAFEKATR